MSFTKELLFGDDPQYDKDRERLREQAAATIGQFPVPLRGKRRGADGKWSPLWNPAVEEAAKELGIQYIRVNDRFAFKTPIDKTTVAERAEVLWQEKVTEHREWLASLSREPER